MDEADHAANLQALENEGALSRMKRAPAIAFTGRCRWCDEPVEHPRRFCGPACSDEFEKLQRRGEL